MTRTVLSTVALLLVLVLLETALLSNIVVLPAVPDLLLLAVLFVAMHNGPMAGTVTGFVSGLFLDFLSAAPLGLNCMLRTAAGFVAGLLRDTLNVTGILIPALLGLVATVVKAVMIQIISFFFPGGIVAYDLLSVEFASELALNTVLAPVMFWLLSLFSSLLAPGKETGI